MFDLTGRRALVTGASGGIGGAIARVLHAQGAQVTLSGTRADRLQALADELGGRAHVATADLADPESVALLASRAESLMGGVDILVNNAGLTRDQLALRMKDADWDIVLQVNLKSAFLLSRAVLRGMVRQRHGRIISIASVSGILGNAGQANYAASKAGLMGMSRALARESATRGVTVNCVAPGFIETPMTAALTDAQRDALMPDIPAARMGTPAEIAAGVLYLASDEAAYVTGHTLSINGGMSMN